MGYMKLHVFFWTDPEPATQHDHDFGIKVPTFSKEAGDRSSRLESAGYKNGRLLNDSLENLFSNHRVKKVNYGHEF